MPFSYPEGSVFKSLSDIKDKKIVIMGLGLSGGGKESARFFLRHGAFVTVSDLKKNEELKDSVEDLKSDSTLDSSKLRFVLGSHQKEDFLNADVVIKNPVVKREGNAFLDIARAVESDISVFLSLCPTKKIIAVTGSKGKSSTVSALYYGLKKANKEVFLGGNISVNPLTFLHLLTSESIVILELSSWQLRDLRGRKLLKPYIACITKIVKDHQNWYEGNMDEYISDKKLIYENQDKNDYLLVSADEDAEGKNYGDEFASSSHAFILRYSRHKLKEGVSGAYLDAALRGFVRLSSKEEEVLGEMRVGGTHIRENVLNAILMMRVLNVEACVCKESMKKWKGVPHRMEFFHEYKNRVRFYNDSCATVPEAVEAAISTFTAGVILISGGTDKNSDFSHLASFIKRAKIKGTLKNIYLLKGSGSEKLKSALLEEGVKFSGDFENLDSLLCALWGFLHECKKESLNVVFSPGAASFELFKNEFDRGETFKRKVKALFV